MKTKFNDYRVESVWEAMTPFFTPRQKEINELADRHRFTDVESENLLRMLSDLAENLRTKSHFSDAYTTAIVEKAEEFINQIKTGKVS